MRACDSNDGDECATHVDVGRPERLYRRDGGGVQGWRRRESLCVSLALSLRLAERLSIAVGLQVPVRVVKPEQESERLRLAQRGAWGDDRKICAVATRAATATGRRFVYPVTDAAVADRVGVQIAFGEQQPVQIPISLRLSLGVSEPVGE